MVDRRLYKVCGINLFHVRRENQLKRCDAIKRIANSQNRTHQQEQDLKCNDHPARKRAKGGLNPFMKSILPSILPHSLPWNENEIRLVDTTPIRTLSKWSWQVVEKEIVVGHDMFLQGKRERNEDVTPYVVKCMYYCEDMMCGVIEVASIGDVVKFRDDVIPFLELTIRITALLRNDKSFPVVAMFASQFYDIFPTERILEMLKMLHPVFEKQGAVDVLETNVLQSGRQFNIRTSPEVLQYIRLNNFVLQLPIGEAIFHKRTEFISGETVTSKQRLLTIT